MVLVVGALVLWVMFIRSCIPGDMESKGSIRVSQKLPFFIANKTGSSIVDATRILSTDGRSYLSFHHQYSFQFLKC